MGNGTLAVSVNGPIALLVKGIFQATFASIKNVVNVGMRVQLFLSHFGSRLLLHTIPLAPGIPLAIPEGKTRVADGPAWAPEVSVSGG